MKVRNMLSDFSKSVYRYFDFLISKYEFSYHKSGIGYEKGDLSLEFYYGKGELNVVFFVKRRDEIFKPFISRSFDLHDIVNKEGSCSIDWVTFPYDNVDKALEFYAKALKGCDSLLRGDFLVFEEIHLKRRGIKREEL